MTALWRGGSFPVLQLSSWEPREHLGSQQLRSQPCTGHHRQSYVVSRHFSHAVGVTPNSWPWDRKGVSRTPVKFSKSPEVRDFPDKLSYLSGHQVALKRFNTASWSWDTPPVPGNLSRQMGLTVASKYVLELKIMLWDQTRPASVLKTPFSFSQFLNYR